MRQDKINAGQGIWCLLGEPLTTAQIALGGIGWITLDQQHGAFDDAATIATISLLNGLPERPRIAVRIAELGTTPVGRALDAGAEIVIVPMIETVEHARQLVRAAHHPPLGQRSWGSLVGLWGAQPVANSQLEVWAMIETATGLANVEQILAVEGITGVLVGPLDLALSLGTRIDALISLAGPADPLPSLAAAAAAAGKKAAIFAGTPERATAVRAMGFEFIAVSTDTGVIAEGLGTVLPTPTQ
ncbi:MAG: HpcH/HpaI aldolase family protein [Brooklawnia sp.]|jgi:4-hydroxy-2-oxoheptanedioate aldolase